MFSLEELTAAADAGKLTAEHSAAVARWLRWADVHYPLVCGIRALAEVDCPDPTAPLAMAEVR